MPFYQRRGDVPAQAAHRLSRERTPSHRRGDGPRRLHRQRVDPVSPRIALPREGARRVHADRARGVGPGDARAPAHEHVGRRARRRRDQRAPHAHVELGRRDLALPAGFLDGLLLPERRGRRGHLRPRGLGHARDDLRRRRLQGGRLHRRPAGDDVPLRAGGGSAVPGLRDPGADRDPAPLPQPVRPDPRRGAVLPPRHPPAGRAEDAS